MLCCCMTTSCVLISTANCGSCLIKAACFQWSIHHVNHCILGHLQLKKTSSDGDPDICITQSDTVYSAHKRRANKMLMYCEETILRGIPLLRSCCSFTSLKTRGADAVGDLGRFGGL
ncbi:hypothetical protein BCR41DRAFT_375529 [Lobosporangium transversale]|uniref:Secreted protein n=1 Tax=Lobosporangium transversale TaxID=64571 RepID=A0A1Y2G839_9FUNG|nr:hypothetical protein BCR41DRAFT_375518 [Lobosporangium transversale]XP_021875816.1 hypothetical protein BCR41DRAFT_375529 [Lobosporangium transversale]ORY98436.1 hypothetical protein BCR41DRAFT_375518 [Lobosporangium transversale]ORY98445.1 hypothetical protein BCR41DRAFT_375529 [Lobosporangium transversale]|eukprot:XP_021875807.1 hypothetical protein BCR41DRAFT_375518 [Lobosporangium transversale]